MPHKRAPDSNERRFRIRLARTVLSLLQSLSEPPEYHELYLAALTVIFEQRWNNYLVGDGETSEPN